MQNARQLLEHLLAKGKLEAAIEGSLILARHYSDQERSADAAQHSARYHTLMDDYQAGTLSDDDYRPERARINRAMLELVHEIPLEWTDEALQKADFFQKSFDSGRPAQQKGFWQKRGLWLGILAIFVVVLGVTMKNKLFSDKNQTDQTQPAGTQTGKTEAPANAEPTQNSTQRESSPSSKIPAEPQAGNNPSTGSETRKIQPVSIPKVDQKFRSFAGQKIVENMERGYMDGKFAFRNVRNKEILCCFSDAQDFSGGKAYVSKDGRNYFYIDKQGNVVQ
jgi:hypothetical protein